VITKGERGAGVFERGGWGRWPAAALGCRESLGVGDKGVIVSVGVEKVPTKNETATDFRL
jgi:hypothetical protein